jgi:hypothetical protein
VSRNITVSALMMTSEELCIAHRKTMYGNDAAANIAFGTFTGLFAGAAAVVSHEATQSLLAALAAFSNAERSLVNETVYKTILVPAVDRKIGEIRATKAASINASLQGDLDAYPVTVALNEVVAFHYSCSFMTGLERALAEGTQGTTAQRILKLRETLRSIVARRQVLRCVDDDASSAPAESEPDASVQTPSAPNPSAPNASAQSSEECATLKMRLDAAADALSKAETEQ